MSRDSALSGIKEPAWSYLHCPYKYLFFWISELSTKIFLKVYLMFSKLSVIGLMLLKRKLSLEYYTVFSNALSNDKQFRVHCTVQFFTNMLCCPVSRL